MNTTIAELQQAVDSAINYSQKAKASIDLCEALSVSLEFEKLLTVSSVLLETTLLHNDSISSAWASLHYGIALIHLKKYKEAAEKFAYSTPIFEQMNDKAGIARTLLNIGRTFTFQQEYKVALEYYSKALDLELELFNAVRINRVIENISGSHIIAEKYEESRIYLKQLLVKFEENVYSDSRAFIYMQIASISMSQLSDYQQAIEYYGKAASVYHLLGNKVSESKALDFIGGAYWYLGDTGLSIEYALRSVAIAEEAANLENLMERLINAAYSYMRLEDYEKVIEINQRVKSVSIESQLPIGIEKTNALIAWADMGIAMALLSLGDANGSLEYARSAVDHFEHLKKYKQKQGLGYAYFRCGEALIALQKYDEAFEAFKKSLEYRISINLELETAETQCELGKLLAHFGRFNEAIEMLHQALDIAEKKGGKAVMYASHKALSDLYFSLEDYLQAFLHLQKYMTVRDEVHSKENSVKATRMEYIHKQELQRKEQEATDLILNNVLPISITKRLKAGEKLIADTIEEVSVLFADVVGFTPLASRLTAEDLVKLLACIFKHFDDICLKHGLEKIKTIGDAYMAVAGAPDPCDDHALRCARAALEMLEDFTIPPDLLQEDLKNIDLDFRIGIHTGSAVAGVIGESKFAYDLWGDAVNTASRMESYGEPRKIHVSEEFARKLDQTISNKEGVQETSSFILGDNLKGVLVTRGEMEIKGKGIMRTYFLEVSK